MQEEYPYHYGTLPANDQLYGGHPDFIAEVTKPLESANITMSQNSSLPLLRNFKKNHKVSSMASTILSLITDHINFLKESKQDQAADQVVLNL